MRSPAGLSTSIGDGARSTRENLPHDPDARAQPLYPAAEMLGLGDYDGPPHFKRLSS